MDILKQNILYSLSSQFNKAFNGCFLVLAALFLLTYQAPVYGVASICNQVVGNLVTNCGAEVGSLSSWNVNNSVALYAQDEFFNSGIYGIIATTQGTENPTTAVFMNQNINTTPGQTYTLSYYLSQDEGNLNSFKSKWNGQIIQSLNNSSAFGFTLFSYNVLATSSITTLQFEFVNQVDYWFFDDISLVAVSVPEPMTWLILGSSLGLINFIRRRSLIQHS